MSLKTSRRSFLIGSTGSAVLLANGLANEASNVETLKAPAGALQPQAAVDAQDVVHLIYLKGDPAAADIFYTTKAPRDRDFTEPIRVNSQPGSAIALGTVRGANLAIGKSGRIHVAWNGSSAALPKAVRNSIPMLYTQLTDRKDAFEPQRSVMTFATGLDGGGTLSADDRGKVYVAWHAQGQQNGKPVQGEDHRRVYLARSTDDGQTFETEMPVSPETTGVCGCCGMGAIADEAGNLYMLYRSARQIVHRDMYLLTSRDAGKTFESLNLQPWEIGACPMSTVSLAAAHGRVLLAWETDKQVYFAPVRSHTLQVGQPVAAPGAGINRKHPSLALSPNGETLLVWTEGTGWKKGGSLAWQRFNEAAEAIGPQGTAPGLPPWDFAAAVSTGNRFFAIS